MFYRYKLNNHESNGQRTSRVIQGVTLYRNDWVYFDQPQSVLQPFAHLIEEQKVKDKPSQLAVTQDSEVEPSDSAEEEALTEEETEAVEEEAVSGDSPDDYKKDEIIGSILNDERNDMSKTKLNALRKGQLFDIWKGLN